mmetsp:Transcript_44037/g.124616  ORF Transcript_44037/g.124616 Transcript_44037/m.124616 type:complete len:391 (+) Transcript_44037:142-1314(+)
MDNTIGCLPYFGHSGSSGLSEYDPLLPLEAGRPLDEERDTMDGGAWHHINTTTTSAATPASEQLSHLLQTIQECKCTTGGGAELHRFAHCCLPQQQQPAESGYVTTRSSASSGSGSSDEDQLRDLLMMGSSFRHCAKDVMLSLPRGWGEASSTRRSARSRGRPAKVGLRNKIGTPMAREDKVKEVKREKPASRSEGQTLADAADAAAAVPPPAPCTHPCVTFTTRDRSLYGRPLRPPKRSYTQGLPDADETPMIKRAKSEEFTSREHLGWLPEPDMPHLPILRPCMTPETTPMFDALHIDDSSSVDPYELQSSIGTPGPMQGVFQEDDGMTTYAAAPHAADCAASGWPGWPQYNDSFCAHMPAVYEHPFPLPLPVQQPAIAIGSPCEPFL